MLYLTVLQKENKLDGIECYEPIDLKCLRKLLTSDLLLNSFWSPITRQLIGTETKQLERIRILTSLETRLAKIKYVRVSGMSYGRSNPVGGVGMFLMRKMIRDCFAKRAGLRDIDIVNAHPTMLLQICQVNDIECKNLETYVSDRESILTELMDIIRTHYVKIQLNASEDDIRWRAKNLFIRLLFFGCFYKWRQEERDDTGRIVVHEIPEEAFEGHEALLAYIDAFTKELQKIGNAIKNANPKLVKEAERNIRNKKKKNPNLVGTVVSFYIQEYEIQVLECLFDYCCKKGYIKNNVCVLCADGIMLEGKLIEGVDIATEFNKIVKDRIGFDLKFTEKPITGSLTDEELESHQLSEKDFDKSSLERFDAEYFSSLDGYQRRKVYFEQFVCKIMRPDAMYAYTERNWKGIDDVKIYTPTGIANAFNHLKSGETSKNGEEIKFMTTWLNDSQIKCYNNMDFIPYNERQPPRNLNVFNLFRGFNPVIHHPYDISKSDSILKPWKDLAFEICGAEQESFEYFLDYLADIFQNPMRKCPIAFIIRGKEGAGKNVFLQPIGDLLTRAHFISSSNPNDFFGTYAEGFSNKLLINMNECESKGTFDIQGRIKSFITEEEVTMNAKNMRPVTVLNLARNIAFSNRKNPIPIDAMNGDRRWVAFKTTEKYTDKNKYGSNYWLKMIEHLKKPEFLACLYDFFMNRDLSNFQPSKRPITKAYIEMCRAFIPSEVLFLHERIVDNINQDNAMKECIDNPPYGFELEEGYVSNRERLSKEGILGVTLFKDYISWCKEFGFSKDLQQKTIKNFYSSLRDLSIRGITEKNPNNQLNLHFDVDEVLAFFKEKRWIDNNDNALNEELLKDKEGEDFTDYFNVF